MAKSTEGFSQLVTRVKRRTALRTPHDQEGGSGAEVSGGSTRQRVLRHLACSTLATANVGVKGGSLSLDANANDAADAYAAATKLLYGIHLEGARALQCSGGGLTAGT